MHKHRGFVKVVAAGVVLVALFALLLVLFVAYTSAYNIAASQDHSPFVRWVFSTTMQNSVAVRADESDVPAAFSEAQIGVGAQHYKAMCEHCLRAQAWSEPSGPAECCRNRRAWLNRPHIGSRTRCSG